MNDEFEKIIEKYEYKLYENKKYILYLESMIKTSLDSKNNSILVKSENINEINDIIKENELLKNELYELRKENLKLQDNLSKNN